MGMQFSPAFPMRPAPAFFQRSPAPFPMPMARPAPVTMTAKLADLNEGLAAGLLSKTEHASLRVAAFAAP